MNIASQFDAILFDKDGTIFDSETMSYNAWKHTAAKYNVAFSAQLFEQFIGVPTDECYQMAHTWFGTDFPIDDFIVENRRYINQQKANGLVIKKGFEKFFEFTKSLNIPLGVVTSAGYQSTLLSFQKTSFYQALDILVTVDDVDKPKPAPDCYLLACRKLGVDPNKTLVFEDSNPGIEAGLAAGCCTVAIPDRVAIRQALQDRCERVIDSFDEAYSLVSVK